MFFRKMNINVEVEVRNWNLYMLVGKKKDVASMEASGGFSKNLP